MNTKGTLESLVKNTTQSMVDEVANCLKKLTQHVDELVDDSFAIHSARWAHVKAQMAECGVSASEEQAGNRQVSFAETPAEESDLTTESSSVASLQNTAK